MSEATLPRLYSILDAECFRSCVTPAAALLAHAGALIAAGATLVQYRNKRGNPREVLSEARELRHLAIAGVRLIMNDRPDLCLASGFDGVHVGQEDLSVDGARAVVGPDVWVGISTHSGEQVRQAAQTSADYVAVGPVFATQSKANPDPVIGLEGVRAARAAISKPLVAIGGITRENARSVIDAGADSVAVISDLLREPAKSVEAFLRILG
jgi:thiamine-phosphate pyrophosphorylase